MQQTRYGLIVSATDLAGHLLCDHLTTSETAVATGHMARPQRTDVRSDVLALEGLLHEARYVDLIRNAGDKVTVIRSDTADLRGASRLAHQTRKAMFRGDPFIYQGAFMRNSPTAVVGRHPLRWTGHADMLMRVEAKTELGDWGYEVIDTKLALKATASALVQTSNYSWQVAEVQGALPRNMHVATGDMKTHSYEVDEFDAYHQMLMTDLERAVMNPRQTYALPVEHCPSCAFLGHCSSDWERNDDLIRNTNKRNRAALIEDGVNTVFDLGTMSSRRKPPPGMGANTQTRLRTEAKLTISQRQHGGTPFEVVAPEKPGQGLAGLPEPSVNDLYLDLEGGPTPVGELQYIWGVGRVGPRGGFSVEQYSAFDAAAEKATLERFLDEAFARFTVDPTMHVHHYAPYETTWLRNLTIKYGTREEEFRTLERAGVFVDNYRILHQALRLPSGRYGLKDAEALWGQIRAGEVTDAAQSMLEIRKYYNSDQRMRKYLRNALRYNKDDVLSLRNCHLFLEQLRAEMIARGTDVPRPTQEEKAERVLSEAQQAHADRVAEAKAVAADEKLELQRDLLALLPEDPDTWDQADLSRRLIFDMTEWHRREASPEWSEYFARLRMTPEELTEDPQCIGELVHIPEDKPQVVVASYVHQYRFDASQSQALRVGKKVLDPETGKQAGTIYAIEYHTGNLGILKLLRGKSNKAPHPRSVMPPGPVGTEVLSDAIVAFGKEVVDNGLDGGLFGATKDFVMTRPPRVTGHADGTPLILEGMDTHLATVDLVRNLDHSTLVVQGPPGTGKTYLAALLVLDAIDRGQKVAITGSNHSNITNLVDAIIAQRGDKSGLTITQRAPAGEVPDRVGVTVADENANVDLTTSNVVAGTPWLFARPEMRQQFDLMIVDEGGQMSATNAVAATLAARNVVIMGDQQQLEQTIRGSHPNDASVSALNHYVEAQTIEAHRGIFIPKTRRMSEGLTEVVSHLSYRRQLHSHEGAARQRVLGNNKLAGTGVKIIFVDHDNNTRSSREEAHAVSRVIKSLTGRSWRNHRGEEHQLTVEDFIVQSPWNEQANLLTRITGNKALTVDRAQGREAPVSIYSMATSSLDDLTRSWEFLLSQNRLNVALSRGKTETFVVMSPKLLLQRADTPEQMRALDHFWKLVDSSEVFDKNLRPLELDIHLPTALAPKLELSRTIPTSLPTPALSMA